MSDGLSALDQRIGRFEELLEEMREATREAHSTLKEIRQTRREIETMLKADVQKMVHDRCDEVVMKELGRIGPIIQEQTSRIYNRIGREIDKLIDISLGKEQSTKHGREDLRPALAAKLKIWLREIIMEEGMLDVIGLEGPPDRGSGPVR